MTSETFNEDSTKRLLSPIESGILKEKVMVLKSYKSVWVDGKLVRYHRLVMERHLGRKLLSSEIVHHKDENIWNNSIENLEITDRVSHARHHSFNTIAKKELRALKGKVHTCCECGKQRYYSPNVKVSKKYKCGNCKFKNGKTPY